MFIIGGYKQHLSNGRNDLLYMMGVEANVCIFGDRNGFWLNPPIDRDGFPVTNGLSRFPANGIQDAHFCMRRRIYESTGQLAERIC